MSEDWATPPGGDQNEGQSGGEQPPPPAQRYSTRVLLISLAVTFLGLALLTPLLLSFGGLGIFSLIATPTAVVVGIVKHRRSTSVKQRSIWMGVILGAAITPILGAGLCIYLVSNWGG